MFVGGGVGVVDCIGMCVGVVVVVVAVVAVRCAIVKVDVAVAVVDIASEVRVAVGGDADWVDK
eukprot:12853688-Alexandrium_andersonii.AAC.1